MQTEPRPIDRRQFVQDIGAGVAAGALLGVGFLAADRWLRHPAVAIVGQAQSQAALVMTPTRHVLLAMGPWSDKLVDAIVPLVGWSNRRLDLVVASAHDAGPAQKWTERRGETSRLALVANSEPAGYATDVTSIHRIVEVQLADSVYLVLEPTYPLHANDQPDAVSPWTALIHRGHDRIWLIQSTAGLEFVAPTHPPTILAVPDGEALSASTIFNARAIASNVASWMQSAARSPTFDRANPPIAIVRTFPSEPAIFEFVDAGIRVPSWTRELAQPAASADFILPARIR